VYKGKSLYTTVLLRFGAFSNSLSISASEMVLGIIMLMALFKVYKTKDYSIFKKGFFIFYMLMISAELISTFTGIDPERSVKDLTSFWVLSYLPALYVVFEGRNKIGYLVYVFIGSIVSSIYGIAEFFYKHMERADGFFSHSLTYGNVLAMVCITAVGVILFKCYDNKTNRNITILCLLVGFPALFLSASRGPILAFLIMAFIMTIYRFRWKGFIAGVVGLLIIVGAITQVPSVDIRFTQMLENIHNSKSSIGTRLVLWEASSKAIMARPWFGYGKRNFKSEVSKYINVPTSSRAHAHNSYIQYTFLHGFFGLFAFLGFLGSLIWEIVRRRRSSPFIKIALFVVMVFILEGITENALGDSEVVIMCLSLAGLMLAPGRPAIYIDEMDESI